MKIPSKKDLIKLALGSAVLVLVMNACVITGVRLGENNINARWQKEKADNAEAILVLKGRLQQKELGHRQETNRISEQLRKTEDQYEKARSSLAAERAQRLRLSAERAAGYARLTEGGSAELRGLASHAAELDRALEEGRGLVAELKEALGQRDAQLRLLGAQITNDRTLLDGH